MPILENDEIETIQNMSNQAKMLTEAIKDYKMNPNDEGYQNIVKLFDEFSETMEMNAPYIDKALDPQVPRFLGDAKSLLAKQDPSVWYDHKPGSFDTDDREINFCIQAMQMQKLNTALPGLLLTLDPVNADQIKKDNAKDAAKKLVGTLVNLTSTQITIERQLRTINERKRELASPEELEPFLKEFKKTLERYEKHIKEAKALMNIADQPNVHAVSAKVKEQCEAHIKFFNDERLAQAFSLHMPLNETASRSPTPNRDRE